MNPLPPNDGPSPLPAHSPREELEARLTALVLGEAGEVEAETLRARLKTDPELAALHRRLEAAALAFEHTFEEEHTANSLPKLEGIPERLSPDRAERLAKLFVEDAAGRKAEAPAATPGNLRPLPSFQRGPFVQFLLKIKPRYLVAASLLLFGLIGSLLVVQMGVSTLGMSKNMLGKRGGEVAQVAFNAPTPVESRPVAPMAAGNVTVADGSVGLGRAANNLKEGEGQPTPENNLSQTAQDYKAFNVLSAADLAQSVANSPPPQGGSPSNLGMSAGGATPIAAWNGAVETITGTNGQSLVDPSALSKQPITDPNLITNIIAQNSNNPYLPDGYSPSPPPGSPAIRSAPPAGSGAGGRGVRGAGGVGGFAGGGGRGAAGAGRGGPGGAGRAAGGPSGFGAGAGGGVGLGGVTIIAGTPVGPTQALGQAQGQGQGQIDARFLDVTQGPLGQLADNWKDSPAANANQTPVVGDDRTALVNSAGILTDNLGTITRKVGGSLDVASNWSNNDPAAAASFLNGPGNVADSTAGRFAWNVEDEGAKTKYAINDGTLNVGSASALGTGTLTFVGGTLGNTSGASASNGQNWNGNVDNFDRNAVVANNMSLGSVKITNNALTLEGGGTLQLGNGTNNGAVAGGIVDNGNLLFDEGIKDTTVGSLSGNINNGALLGQNQSTQSNFTVATTLTGGSVSGNIVDNGALVFNQGADSTYGGVISGSGSVNSLATQAGGDKRYSTAGPNANTYNGGTTISAGTLQLGNGTTNGFINTTGNVAANYNRGFSGNTFVLGGALVTGNTGALQNSTVNYNTGGGTLNFGTLSNVTMGGLSGNQNPVLVNNTGGGVALTVGSNSAKTTYSGTLSGTGSLVKSGNGTLILSGNQTYTGATQINANTLTISASTIGSGSAPARGMVFNGGSLQFSQSGDNGDVSRTLKWAFGGIAAGNDTFDTNGNDVTLTNNLAGTGGIIRAGSGTLTFSEPLATLANGVSGSAGNLTMAGTGTLVFNGASTYTGGTNPNLGEGDLWSAPNVTVNAGTLRMGGGFAVNQTGGTLTLTGTTNTYSGGVTQSGGSTPLAGGASLTKASAGNLTLTGTNTFGTTTNNAGETYTGGMVLNGGTLQINNLILSGANTFNGTTNITAGTLPLNFAQSGAAPNQALSSASVLTLGGGSTFVIGNGTANSATLVNGNLGNSGTGYAWNSQPVGRAGATGGPNQANSGDVTKVGSGSLTLSGSNSYTGGVVLNSGTINLHSVTVSGGNLNRTVTVGDGSAFNPSSAIATNIKDGTGTWTLVGNNTYTGNTTISSGTLQLGTSGTMNATLPAFATSGASASPDSSGTLAFGFANGTANASADNNGVGTYVGRDASLAVPPPPPPPPPPASAAAAAARGAAAAARAGSGRGGARGTAGGGRGAVAGGRAGGAGRGAPAGAPAGGPGGAAIAAAQPPIAMPPPPPPLVANAGAPTVVTGLTNPNSVIKNGYNAPSSVIQSTLPADIPVSRPPSEVKFPPAVTTVDNAFSTFALNVSDAAYQLARAALLNRRWPDPASTRTEEFLNAFNYHDPAPGTGEAAAFNYDLGQNPIESSRDLLRVSFSTAAAGRDRATPLHLTILLDGSGSMTRADRVATLQAAVRSLGSLLRPGDTVSLVTFARTPQVRAQNIPAERFGEIVKIISELQPDGGTNMEEALKTAYAIALASYDAKAQNRVILLTDGAANLGELDPASLAGIVEENRKIGIALDAYGVGWDGYDDTTLEALTRKSDGRYAFLNTPDDVNAAFAQKLAGALTPAAQDVKLQIEFNPARVTSYRLMGYNNLRLTKEQFRDNSVSAGEIAAAEQGTALYNLVLNPQGRGPIGTARARYRDPGTDNYHELTWTIQYQGLPPAFDRTTPALRLAAVAAYFAEYLQESPFATEASPQKLLDLLHGVPEAFAPDQRPAGLAGALQAAITLGGK